MTAIRTVTLACIALLSACASEGGVVMETLGPADTGDVSVAESDAPNATDSASSKVPSPKARPGDLPTLSPAGLENRTSLPETPQSGGVSGGTTSPPNEPKLPTGAVYLPKPSADWHLTDAGALDLGEKSAFARLYGTPGTSPEESPWVLVRMDAKTNVTRKRWCAATGSQTVVLDNGDVMCAVEVAGEDVWVIEGVRTGVINVRGVDKEGVVKVANHIEMEANAVTVAADGLPGGMVDSGPYFIPFADERLILSPAASADGSTAIYAGDDPTESGILTMTTFTDTEKSMTVRRITRGVVADVPVQGTEGFITADCAAVNASCVVWRDPNSGVVYNAFMFPADQDVLIERVGQLRAATEYQWKSALKKATGE